MTKMKLFKVLKNGLMDVMRYVIFLRPLGDFFIASVQGNLDLIGKFLIDQSKFYS